MDLSSLKYAKGSHKKAKRIGRGDSSGHGGTSTRGHKGQHSRSGSKRKAWFEGGQMPLQRRIPKRGFTNIFKTVFQPVNLTSLNRLDGISSITPEVLRQHGVIRKRNLPVKILGKGELSRAVEVHAHGFSKGAQEKIARAGGKAIVIQPAITASAQTKS
ncbi:MAG: 50S ribosomal protein L15 [candidate division KSB1 bacterium]|nr:50S ribosomal protein L15 [candidate division KSB1 bacterium]MDZ7272513.1 50S ribosomal protein L15 [candidate division KSB1 bacterium]MDZ7284463.1 50S ribosomal protein L15 [candidate division KSB1 bacterium]MDZ7297141.1 50S ribosomal protein L15 [candidate division KSB1 bacterium]MDZ7306720.1 50S ribosomal protein L15 [candidate division KSB1 bacterium]